MSAVSASHPEASLAGSNFEIDTDANLKLDDPAPSIDWGSIAQTTDTPPGPEIRGVDLVTGQNDDSYKGGVKEDTACPGEVTGSIPNNKSDLLTFHGFSEAGDPGYFNFAWSRVSEPSGTTLMDFEFNQSATACTTGPNVTRTAGDLLVEYAIDQGGARADISARTWTGTAWGPSEDLDTSTECGGGPCAAGTISTSAIPAAESDGLGAKDPRTFGEAQIDLRFLQNEDTCISFGSMMVKSRSSDAFTSQLKDFIRPIPVNLTNCGSVIIRKQTIPDEDPNTTLFDYTSDVLTDPVVDTSFDLTDDESQTFSNVVQGSYTVNESAPPAGWVFDHVDCSASTGVSVDITQAPEISFTIDDASDVVDCTYFNEQLAGALRIHKDRKHAADGPGDHPHAGVSFNVSGVGDFVTDPAGDICVEGLAPGDYTITESLPAGYHNDTLTDTYTVVDDTTCATAEVSSFVNMPLTNVTVEVDSQVDGGTASTIECVDADPDPDAVTDANGDGSLVLNDLEPQTLVCTIVIDP